MLIIASSPNNTREIFYPQNNTIITLFLYLWHIKHHRHFYESINGGEPTCIDDDIPFEIPDSWEWVRLEHIVQVVTGKTPSTQQCDNYEPSEICFYKPADINEKFCYIEQAKEQVSTKGASCAPLLPSNSILVSCIGNIGKCSIISKEGICNQQINAVLPSSHLNMLLLLYFLRSEEMKQQEIEHSSATTISILNKSTFVSLLIPLPPKDEQKRITDCINTYFTQLDAIGDSRQRYKRILFETPTSLRQQLIQSAIQGRLVPQNPNDEPASKLLERLAEERTAKLGKKAAKSMCRIERRGSKTYVEVLSDKSEKDISMEIPFEIPDNWEWVRLGDIGVWGSGATPNRREHAYYNGNIPWLKTGDLTDGYITDIPERISELALNKTSVKLNPAGSVLMAMYGATIGKLGILTYPATTNQACCACTPYFGVNNHFLFYYLLSQRNLFIKKGEGGAQPNISKEKITHTLFPLPPVNEQIIICKKLKRLLELLSN